jgi:hypothetical protein
MKITREPNIKGTRMMPTYFFLCDKQEEGPNSQAEEMERYGTSFRESKNFRQAEEWDILQHTSMTPEQKQEASEQLRHRVYGTHTPDVREAQHLGLDQLIINKEAIKRPKDLEDLRYLKKAKEAGYFPNNYAL